MIDQGVQVMERDEDLAKAEIDYEAIAVKMIGDLSAVGQEVKIGDVKN